MSEKSVFISGFGAVTAAGNSAEELWSSLLEKKTHSQKSEKWSSLYEGDVLCCEVSGCEVENRDLRANRLGEAGVFACSSVEEIIENVNEIPEDTGVSIGKSSPGEVRTLPKLCSGEDFRSSDTLSIFRHSTASTILDAYDISGPVHTPSSEAISGLEAIQYAVQDIQMDNVNAMFAGGSDELCLTFIKAYDSLRMLSENFMENPIETPRPFGKERDGLVPGEGSGMLFLESSEESRNKAYAEITGIYKSNVGGLSPTESSTVESSIRGALSDCDKKPEDIDLYVSHASGTIPGDETEAEAIESIFSDNVPVTTPKSSIGHTLGGSGPISTIVGAKSIDGNIIPPTPNSGNCEYDIDVVSGIRQKEIETVVVTGFVFGNFALSMVLEGT